MRTSGRAETWQQIRAFPGAAWSPTWDGGSGHPSRVVMIVGLTFILAACGSGDDASSPTPPPTLTAATAPAGVPPIAASPALATPTLPAGPPVVPTPGRSSTPFRSDAASVGPVVWATGVDPATKAPTNPVTTFAADAPAIYATLPVDRLTAGTTLGASWRYNGTPLESFLSMVTAETDLADIWAEFHITRSNAEPWPPGVYEITITVNGEGAQTATVAVGTDPI